MNVYYEEYIPPIIKGTKEFSALALSADDCGDQLWSDIDSIWDNQYIATLDVNGCSHWETILGITITSETTIEERRFNILSKVNETLPYDIHTFCNMLKALIGNRYDVTVDNANYKVTISVQPSYDWQVTSVGKLCKRVLPANLIYAIVVNYATWDIIKNHDWSELAELTWEEVTKIED